MQYTRLGKSDLLVSRICMGCMGFGDPSTGQHSWTLDETASRDIIRYGLEKGINFYDTAIAYQNGSRYTGDVCPATQRQFRSGIHVRTL